MPKFPASRHAPERGACDPRRMAMRCLIVDDSPHFLRAASALLEREGIAVVGVASTSAEALRRAQELEPDVALLDVDLGGESGFDLARRLATETSLEPSSLILISTSTQEDFKEDFADLLAASRVLTRRLRQLAFRSFRLRTQCI